MFLLCSLSLSVSVCPLLSILVSVFYSLSLSPLFVLSLHPLYSSLSSPLLSSLSSSLLLSCSPDPFIIINRDAGQVMSVSRFFFSLCCLFSPSVSSVQSAYPPVSSLSPLSLLSSPLSSSALLLPFSAFSLCACSLCPSTGLGYDVIYATGHVCSFFSQPEQASEDDRQAAQEDYVEQ